MHWTLIVLLTLCASCVLTNAFQLVQGRKVGVAGILVCAGWAIQQAYWWLTDDDSFALFLTCDMAIVGWLLFLWWKQNRAFNAAERLIAATIPLATALGAYSEINAGHTVVSWYTNTGLVMVQMLLGLPPVGWVLRRTAEFNRTFDPWQHFNLKKRHAQ